VIRERSVAGTNRVAETGAWLGGIVPYGYRKVGQRREARLVISEEMIPGLSMSEAEVIREVFRLAGMERKSCRCIAKRLQDLGIPYAYARDGLAELGRRKQRTSGMWWAGRVRGLLINKTCMGIHEFGKRAVKTRQVIVRTVPAIVTEALWHKAQQTLHSNLLFSQRNAKNQYLLRGLIKCGSCGRTYVGIAATRPDGRREFYYRCNGAHSASVLGGERRCRSKSVRGKELESQVWSDVEAFLRNPEPVLETLRLRLLSEVKEGEPITVQIGRLEELLAQKANERSRVVGLYRRGRLEES
jgi:site-specific DNA recombinase